MESRHSNLWMYLIIVLLFLIRSTTSRPLKPSSMAADEGRYRSSELVIKQKSLNSQTLEYMALPVQGQGDQTSLPQEGQRGQHSKAIMELKKQVRLLEASFDSGEEDSMRYRYDPTRISPGGPDPHHH